MIYLLIFLLGSPAAAADFCAGAKPVSPKFAAAEAVWKGELVRFADSPPVASKGDALLSTLIEKKSPLVERWMTKNDLYGKPEETIVREWRKYFAESQLAGYPTKDEAMNGEVAGFTKKMGGAIFAKKERERFERIFGEAKAGALAWLGKFPGGDKAASRIKEIRLFWIEEIAKSPTPKSVLEFLDWSVAYDPVPNVINVGLDALKYPNDATLFAVFAHELAHAFDPCRWIAFFPGAENPFAKVQACLRNDASVGAKKRDDSQLDATVAREKLGADFAAMMRANPTCTKREYPPEGVQADQLPESFADWFSAEVTAMSKYAGARGLRADLCAPRDLRAGSSYPANPARLERIYLAHPVLRKKQGLGDSSSVAYCASGVDPLAAPKVR